MIDPQQPIAQAAFAELVGTNQPNVSALVTAGVLIPGGSFAEWLAAYSRYWRDLAFGRGGAAAAERLRILRAKADAAELANARESGAVASTASIAAAGARVGTVTAAALEGMLDRVSMQFPGEPRVRAVLREEIDHARRSIRAAIKEGVAPFPAEGQEGRP
jgi:phage terminase Nu1 subunit (DNA packaging protein)